MAKGRSGSEKPTFTFSTGITVTLERVGPMVALPIERAHPPPSPPLAPGVGGMLEPNPADPDYLRALERHRVTIGLLIQDVILDAGISDDLFVDAATVARIRRVMAAHGTPIPDDESDRMVYLKYVCIGDIQRDFEAFNRALRQYDRPTEEDIGAAEATFRGHRPRLAVIGSAQNAAEE